MSLSRKPVQGLAARERRRCEAIALLQEGWSNVKVAEHFGVSREAVRQWREAFEARGEAGLATGPRPGPKSKLTPKQLERLPKMLERGAE
jgi:transposase